MRILMIAINDPAGTAIAFTKAINTYTEHTCRLITKEIRYNFMFEKDLHLPWLDEDGWGEVEHLLRTSDVFHFHMTADEYIELGDFRLVDFMKGKRCLHHHHGHPDFRGNPEKYREKYRRLKRKAIVSTPDLLKLLPEAAWQPNIVPIEDPLYLPIPVSASSKVRVCQAPTRKDLKNTEAFCAVMERLRTRWTGIETTLIENTWHVDCLRIKQGCDIHFDHMQGYFGVSSLESLSQGKPLVAGLDDWNIKCISEFTGTESLPWIIARNTNKLERCLENLITDKEARLFHGKQSRSFMESCWTEPHVIQSLLDVYESL